MATYLHTCNTILKADSFHPHHLKDNISYGQFQRLQRICDLDKDFAEQAETMSNRFSDRTYNHRVVKRALDSAQSLEHNALLPKKPRLRPQCFPSIN